MVYCDAACCGFSNPLCGCSPEEYVKRVRRGERPEMISMDGSGLAQMVSFMWKFREENRPTAKQVKDRLEVIWKTCTA